MDIKRTPAGIAISMSKSETGRILEAAFIAEGVARNATDRDEVTDAITLGELCRQAAERYGAKHLDENGLLAEPKRRNRDESEAPVAKGVGQ